METRKAALDDGFPAFRTGRAVVAFAALSLVAGSILEARTTFVREFPRYLDAAPDWQVPLIFAIGPSLSQRSEYLDLTPLMASIVAGKHRAVKRILSRHPDLEERGTSEPQTALALAVQSQDPEMVRTLLKAGANPLAKDARGTTPLDHARRLGDPDVLEHVEHAAEALTKR